MAKHSDLDLAISPRDRQGIREAKAVRQDDHIGIDATRAIFTKKNTLSLTSVFPIGVTSLFYVASRAGRVQGFGYLFGPGLVLGQELLSMKNQDAAHASCCHKIRAS